MATIGTDKNGYKRVLFYETGGKRHTVRLSAKSKRIAQTAKYHIEALLDAKINGHSPAPETSRWLAGLDDVIYNRLVNVELVPVRSLKSTVELGKFLSEYLESRTDVKTGTKRNWRQCINRLNTFFGASKPLTKIIEGDADAYKVWLKEEGLSINEADPVCICLLSSLNIFKGIFIYVLFPECCLEELASSFDLHRYRCRR